MPLLWRSICARGLKKSALQPTARAGVYQQNTMNAALLLQWHYLIFLLPFGVAILLLLLSTMRVGGHHARAHGGGHSHGHGGGPNVGGGMRAHGHGHHAVRHGHARSGARGSRHSETNPLSVLFGALGFTKAPLPVVLSSFFLVWGFSGYWANRVLLPHTTNPTLGRVLPSLAIALLGAIVGGRVAAELIARLLPPEETSVVSRDALFGLKGRVAFPVTDTSGRIHVYDEFGTLHDESCRVAPDQPPIARGQTALIVDRDEKGRLLVEALDGSDPR
jgi:hypothetical protein